MRPEQMKSSIEPFQVTPSEIFGPKVYVARALAKRHFQGDTDDEGQVWDPIVDLAYMTKGVALFSNG